MRRAGLMLLLLAAGNALAHPEHGAAGWISASLAHLLSEPDHLAMILGPLLLGGLAIARALLRRRAARADRTTNQSGSTSASDYARYSPPHSASRKS